MYDIRLNRMSMNTLTGVKQRNEKKEKVKVYQMFDCNHSFFLIYNIFLLLLFSIKQHLDLYTCSLPVIKYLVLN